MYPDFLKAISDFVDWLSGISKAKIMWLLVTLMAIGLVILIKHYDNKDTRKDQEHRHQIDSITVFYTRQLENCNNKRQLGDQYVIDVLQQSLQDQQKQTLEIQKLKDETDKLKIKK